MTFWRWRRLMYDRRWRRSRLMHYRRRRWRWLLMHRCWLRRRRVHIVFRLPLRSRRESLRRRIVVLPFRPCWRRAFIIRAPYRFRRRLMVIAWPIKIASAITRTTSRLLINYFRIMVAIDSSMIIVDIWLWLRWRLLPLSPPERPRACSSPSPTLPPTGPPLLLTGPPVAGGGS
jgi:hypothetical protein